MTTAKFSIDEMHCGGCVRSVSAVLTAMPGVTPRNVEVGSAEVEYDPAVSSPGAVAAALTEAGYPAHSRVAAMPVIGATKALGKSAKGGGCGCG